MRLRKIAAVAIMIMLSAAAVFAGGSSEKETASASGRHGIHHGILGPLLKALAAGFSRLACVGTADLHISFGTEFLFVVNTRCR